MTATLDERIAQFEKMAHDDPENDMAHFSLGNAYLQAHRSSDAARSFQRCIQINPHMSKAYQLGGQALIEAGTKPQAVEMLMKGYEVAAGRGDRLPQTAMADLLKSIGREPPSISVNDTMAASSSSSGALFVCRRTGKPGTQMTSPPFRGPVGKWIQENISAETWRTWIGQGTKVINELRLDLSREQDAATYDTHMREYLGIDEDLLQRLTTTS